MTFWTNTRRRHVAETLRTSALGQLAYFGFKAMESGHWLVLTVSVAFAFLLELAAVFFLIEV